MYCNFYFVKVCQKFLHEYDRSHASLLSLLTITKDKDHNMNQLNLKVNTCNRYKARENSGSDLRLVLVSSDWMIMITIITDQSQSVKISCSSCEVSLITSYTGTSI